MGDGQFDHNILKLMSFCVCVRVRVCVNKLVDNSEQKIANNELLKTSLDNV